MGLFFLFGRNVDFLALIWKIDALLFYGVNWLWEMGDLRGVCGIWMKNGNCLFVWSIVRCCINNLWRVSGTDGKWDLVQGKCWFLLRLIWLISFFLSVVDGPFCGGICLFSENAVFLQLIWKTKSFVTVYGKGWGFLNFRVEVICDDWLKMHMIL